MSFRFNIAKGIAGASRFVLKKVLRRPAGFFPGKLALKIDSNLIADIAPMIDGQSVVVTGTNGKTSVTALLAQVLELEHNDVVTNSTGANMESGVASALLEHKFKKRKKTFAVFEVDELWVKKVLPALDANYLLLLDLFPDQADRYGSISNIQDSIIEALKSSPNTVLIYNADDPNCQLIADNCDNNAISFGMHDKISSENEPIVESCPKCGANMTYFLHQYAQLGNYKCNKCGFNRAGLEYGAGDIKLDVNKLTFTIGRTRFTSTNAAEYVCYNLVAFAACADKLGCRATSIVKAAASEKNDKGRLQYFKIDNKKVMINLAKNPAGFNQNIKYVLNQVKDNPATVVFFANTKEGDGRDPSWLNDVNFSLIKKPNLTILYGGEASELLGELTGGIKVDNAHDVLSYDNKLVFIIANYTAMFPLRDELIGMESK